MTENSSEAVAEVLILCFSTFCDVEQWVLDRGIHFKNDLLTILKGKTKSFLHFTLAFFPWSNGTV